MERNIPKLAIAIAVVGILLLPGLLLVTNLPTASASAPVMGRVTVSGPDILVDGTKPAHPFFGVCDTTALAFAIEAYINGNRGVAGWTSVFNIPDTGGHVPVTPNDAPDAFWNQYFAQMKYYGVDLVRIGAGDSWGTQLQYDAWMNHRSQYYDLLHSMSYYAQANGVWLVFVIAGSQEYPTFSYYGSGTVFDPSTQGFANYVTYAKATMVELEHENSIAMYDMYNEPDHNFVDANYWHGDKVRFNTWANAVASATIGVSTHPRTMGVAGFGNLFGMNQADFNLSTGKTGFEILHRHYYGSNTDPYNFQAPEQWARAVGKPLLWGELANNGPYPLVRYDFGEKAIYAAGGQAITSMVLTGTPGYPYSSGATGQGQVPKPNPWPEPVQAATPTPDHSSVQAETLQIVSTPSNESKVSVGYEYKIETTVPAAIEVSTDAPFLDFNLADSTIRGTPGTAGNYSVSIKADVNNDLVYQNYTLTVASEPAKGSMVIDSIQVASGEYYFTYSGDLTGDRVSSILWDFGDGNRSVEAAPAHTFAPGHYLVTLTVSGENGTELNSTYSLVVPASAAPSGGAGFIAGTVQFGSSDATLIVAGLVSTSVIGLLGYIGLVKGVRIPFFGFRWKR